MTEIAADNSHLVERLARAVLRSPHATNSHGLQASSTHAHGIHAHSVLAQRDVRDIYLDAHIDHVSSAACKDIRVLDLDPAKDYDAPLVGRLRVITLSENETEPFSALSYVWGADANDPQHEIALYYGETAAGRSRLANLRITRNCSDALRRIRARHGMAKILAGAHTTIWVDAICINQQDPAEKPHQVLLMKDVYTWADKTFVWLHTAADDHGAQQERMQRLLELVHKASALTLRPMDEALPVPRQTIFWRRLLSCRADMARSCGVAVRFLPFIVLFRLVKTLFIGMAVTSALQKPTFKEDLEALLAHEWFHRAWTYQETLLPCHITVLFGRETELPWTELVRGLWKISVLDTRQTTKLRREDCVCYYRLADGEDDTTANSKSNSFFTLQGLFFSWYHFNRTSSRYPQRLGEVLRRRPRRSQVDVEVGQSTATLAAKASTNVRQALPARIMRAMVVGVCCLNVWMCLAGIMVFFIPIGIMEYRAAAFGIKPSTLVMILSESLGFILAFSAIVPLLSTRSYMMTVEAWGNDDAFAGSWLVDAVADSRATILAMRHRRTTDLRDKAYAFYGIMDALEVDLRPVDYRRPSVDVLRDLCIDMLSWRPAMVMMLIDAGRLDDGDPRDTRPSWMPRWENTTSKSIVFEGHFLKAQTEAHMWSDYFFATILPGGAVLRVAGVPLDTVSFCCEPFSRLHVDSSPAMWTRAVEQFSGWLKTVMYVAMRRDSGLVRRIHPNFWRRWVLRRGAESLPLPRMASMVRYYVVFVLSQTQSCGEPEESVDKMCYPASNFIANHLVYGHPLCASDLAHRLMNDAPEKTRESFRSMINRMVDFQIQPFVTAGGLVGCGSKGVAPGDSVYLIGGVPAPMVLRPALPRGVLEVVCSAFVLGYMSNYDSLSDFDREKFVYIDLV
ncbi:Heterokaryon incompatibility [Niveomyces insectorum RCEF 264]|uniref:Heterokaryon incompatibility n=1 Tax=Niveomyces insectorum RCEF 264 TaxID=1081102 RepID=A0A162MLA5_9HYPO|nr:Heterokaryon incompatibility [Niveomyces insectorum RCEF 264]